MRFRDLREDMDMTQQELATQLNIRQSTLSQYENGQRQIPLNTLIQLALFFDTSTDYLLGLTNERNPYPRISNKAD
ncbi:MAG: helix-turn-helix transcriptional regulator [Clostridia bacterium]|nr:helix-turn-helix transcriptional regulator [Clostridia bacterium]